MLVSSAVLVEVVGGEVIGGEVIGGSGSAVFVCLLVCVLSSLHPHHPGVAHVVLVGSRVFEVVVAGAVVWNFVVVVLSLHPNQPGVSQLCVVEVDVAVIGREVVVTAPEVVVSSRHPHHPGVLHVSVLVLVFDAEDVRDVVVSEELDS